MEGRGSTTEALLAEETMMAENGGCGSVADGEPGSITAVLALSIFAAVSGSYTFGNASGFTSPAETGIRNDLGLSLAEYSVFGSILSLGGLLGAVCSGKLADIIGRRGAMWISDLSSTVGWLAIFFAENAWMLDIGRLFVGFGVGVISYAAPVYIAEVTPKNLRGSLASLCMLMTGFGTSITFIIGSLLNWRILALLGIVPCLLELLTLFLVPESPRWLAKVGRRIEVEVALQRLRGKANDVSKEARDIEVYTENLQDLQHYKLIDLFQKKYARLLIIGVTVMALQQLSGLNGYALYMSSILEKAGASGSIGSTVAAIIQAAGSILAVLFMDKFGRRSLLMVSLSGTCLGNLLTGLSFLFQDNSWWTDSIPTLNFLGVMVFAGFYSIGAGGIPWIIMSEIFPVNVKGPAGSIVNLVSWSGSWLVSYTFNYFFEWSSAGVFFTFATICCLGVLFVAKMVPETKGRTLEEIQASMSQYSS